MVEDYIIFCYNHPTRGDYNTEALIFKMAATQFLDVFKEETSKMKENTVPLTDNNPSNYTKTIILLRLRNYLTIFTSPSVNNKYIIIIFKLLLNKASLIHSLFKFIQDQFKIRKSYFI